LRKGPEKMQELGEYGRRIRQKLEAALHPEKLEILDESARHAGHAGHDPLGETHFKVTVVSAAFEGLSRVARHRLVYDALAAELRERVHALTLLTFTPVEHNHR
jgi:BolA family transcriptional regulator, general stress-responsive regulator